jgi:hypothetical protein
MENLNICIAHVICSAYPSTIIRIDFQSIDDLVDDDAAAVDTPRDDEQELDAGNADE